MESPADFKSVQERIQKSLVSSIKVTNRIAAEELGFHRAVNPDTADLIDEKIARVLDLSNRLLRSAAKACHIKPPKLEDVEDIDMNWSRVVDVVDTVLEKADTALDEYTGIIKRKEPPTADSGPQLKKQKPTTQVIRNAKIPKPQLQFDLPPDNFPTDAWKPLITKKPHALVPLEESLQPTTADDGSTAYRHPYDSEIRNMQYPARTYQEADPVMYQPVDSTTAIWVDTYEGVLDMLKHLKVAKEIAVDLEHHDFRTYTGLVCLMQISTRDQDWIVDTLQPWRHKLEVLNEAFADPSIIKVFHGAYMDMIWLQRDLGLYVNGLFDTYFACELLYPGKSLAYLLSRFVKFEADKAYQLADWRIRPLPQEMLYYARSDTHYLLYIYDNVRNDLISGSNRSNPDTDYIERALHKSRELSLSRHEHPSYDKNTGAGSRGWQNYLLKHSHLGLNGEQFSVFRTLWDWRDLTARKEDESPGFIMGQTHIAEIARFNPQDAKALHSLLPLTAPLARSRVNEIWNLVKETKARQGPSLLQFLSSITLGEDEKNDWALAKKKTTSLPAIDGEVTSSTLPQSHLFGIMPVSTRWEDSKRKPRQAESYFPFPWQKFVGGESGDALQYVEKEADTGPTTESTPSKPPPSHAQPQEEDEDDDEEFTLKRGTKRKLAVRSNKEEEEEEAKEEDPDSDSSLSEEEEEHDVQMQDPDPAGRDGVIQLVDDDDLGSSSKARRKQRRAKKAEEKKLQRAAEKEQKPFSAFDYSKATSVMHASKQNGAAGGTKTDDKKPKRQVFDPYSKVDQDGLKGARKAPPIKGEKSATFKK